MPFKNPVVEIYRGVSIRKYPMVRFRISIAQMKQIIDEKQDNGISERRAVKKLNILCNCDSPMVIIKSEYAKGH
jgi:hypothetical protein